MTTTLLILTVKLSNFNSEMNDVFGFTKKKYPAGTYLGQNPTNVTNFDEVQLRYKCVEGSIVNRRREVFYFLSVLVPHLVCEFFKSLCQFCLGK